MVWNADAFRSLYSYDLNGNFETLTRYKPNVSGGSELLDALDYSHYDGNRLLTVADAATFPETPGIAQFLDQNTTGFDDYEYDAMGNLSQDRHKGVSMTYNHFNKPTEVQGSGEKIVYIYSADGTKLRQKVIDTENPGILKVTDYAGAYQYEDPDGDGVEAKALSFIMHPKGRILSDGSGYTYQYFLTDHLGNTRITFGDLNGDGKINPDPLIADDVEQVADYYPFGLAMMNANAPSANPVQNYTYNGKELQDELGLGWLDYGARMYDPSIARWNGVDALAEVIPSYSPFIYTYADPISFNDPTGMIGEKVKKVSDEPIHLKSTYIGPGGKVIDQINDGDDNIYFVNDKEAWIASGRKKEGLSIIGKEVPGKAYQPGDSWYAWNHTDNAQMAPPQNGALVPDYTVEQLIVPLPFVNLGSRLLAKGINWVWVKVGGKWVMAQIVKVGEKFVLKISQKLFKGVTNVIPEGKLANHLFKGHGKLADTPANRALIQKISNGKPLGKDPYGKVWYMGVDDAGKPIYSYAQNGIVKGAGYMTMTPAEMITKFGIK